MSKTQIVALFLVIILVLGFWAKSANSESGGEFLIPEEELETYNPEHNEEYEDLEEVKSEFLFNNEPIYQTSATAYREYNYYFNFNYDENDLHPYPDPYFTFTVETATSVQQVGFGYQTFIQKKLDVAPMQQLKTNGELVKAGGQPRTFSEYFEFVDLEWLEEQQPILTDNVYTLPLKNYEETKSLMYFNRFSNNFMGLIDGVWQTIQPMQIGWYWAGTDYGLTFDYGFNKPQYISKQIDLLVYNALMDLKTQIEVATLGESYTAFEVINSGVLSYGAYDDIRVNIHFNANLNAETWGA